MYVLKWSIRTSGQSRLDYACSLLLPQTETALKLDNMPTHLRNVSGGAPVCCGAPRRAAYKNRLKPRCESELFKATSCALSGERLTDAGLSSDAAHIKELTPDGCKSQSRHSKTSWAMMKLNRPVQVVLSAFAIALVCATITPPAHASIAEAVAASLRDIAPDWLVVFVLAGLPVVELRGAVPVGISVLGLSPPLAYFLAVMGNMVPVPLILLGLGPLVRASAGVPALYRLLERILNRARKQTEGMDKETIFAALAYFVAIPLPGTGAWSGAIAAFVLDVPFWPAVLSNLIGVCCAGALVTMLTCMGWAGLWLAIIILLVLPLLSFLVKSMRSDPKN